MSLGYVVCLQGMLFFVQHKMKFTSSESLCRDDSRSHLTPLSLDSLLSGHNGCFFLEKVSKFLLLCVIVFLPEKHFSLLVTWASAFSLQTPFNSQRSRGEPSRDALAASPPKIPHTAFIIDFVSSLYLIFLKRINKHHHHRSIFIFYFQQGCHFI